MMKPTILLTLALLTAACSTGDRPSSPAPPPDSPVSTQVPPGGPAPGEPSPSPIEPTPGLSNVHPIQWQDAIVGDDGRAVTLTYFTGVADCYGLDHVDVAYGTKTITVTLYEGTKPGVDACIEMAVFASTTVTLDEDEPVQGRTIVDGAKGDDPAP